MPDLKVHLWVEHQTADPIPTVTFETDSELEAAAMSLRDFKRLGHKFSPELAHVEVEWPDHTINRHLISDVLAWLRKPDQAAFAERESLVSLL
jgi:hypothetical protein